MLSPIRAEEDAMNRYKRLAGIALAIGFFGVAAVTAAGAQDAPKGDAANGKRIYLANRCFTCHGRAGQGGAYNTPTPILAHTVLPFEGFKGQIRNPANDMPAYSNALLSDQDIADLYAFVQSLPGPSSPKDIPILNN
jgi:mono/diheme cytochrome c family protein